MEEPPLPRAANMIASLVECGATHVLGIPDNGTARLFERLEIEPAISTLTVAREGEAFAVASGLWLGGAAPVVLIQNTGLLESGDALRGTASRIGVPLLCLVGYRGVASLGNATSVDVAAEPGCLLRADLDSAALLTEPTLVAWKVPYEHFRSDRDLPMVAAAWTRAHAEQRPIALLLHRGFAR